MKKGYAIIKVGNYGGEHPVHISDFTADTVSVCWPGQHIIIYKRDIVKVISTNPEDEHKYYVVDSKV
jgi:hypothetical protein